MKTTETRQPRPRSGTLWIDVTDLTTWRGNLTGIQRTHFNLGQEFAREENVKFFSAGHSTGIKEVSLPTAESFAQPDKPQGSPELSRDAKVSAPALRFGRRTINRILPRRAVRILRRLRNGLQNRWPNAPVSTKQSATPESATPESTTPESTLHPFSPNDTVLILGATWGTDGFPEMLCELRSEVRFRLVFTVYDIIPALAPHFFGPGFGPHFAQYLMKTIQASDALLSISENTTRDLERFMAEQQIPNTPIINFRLGDDPLTVVGQESPRPEIVAGEFILVVGTIEVRKNHQVLYQAWELAAKEGVPLPILVIVGKPGWNVNDLLYDISANPLTAGRIIIVSNVDDPTLGWLYSNCLMTVYPSWYEGWGLPVAESLHFGKLCISSSASSMPEIGGDLVEYCDPYSPRDFLNTIYRFVNNRAQLQTSESRIINEYKSVTWRQSFEEIKRGLDQLSRDTP